MAKGIFDSPDSCNYCGGVNRTKMTERIEHTMCECETECEGCGKKDYWAYGHFESGQEMAGKCRKY